MPQGIFGGQTDPLAGFRWVRANWLYVCIACVPLAAMTVLLVRRWLRAQQRAKALFDFTLAETLRKKGDNRGAIKAYDKILSLSCPEQLVWRCHSGRAMALLARKEHTAALADIDRALTLAAQEEQVAEKQRQAKATAAAAAAAAVAAKKKDDDAAAPPPRARVTDDEDYLNDPLLSLPRVSLALLHYQRGLILDATANKSAETLAAFRLAAQLEPELDFLVGHVARKRFEERLKQGQEQGGAQQQEAESEAQTDGKRTGSDAAVQKRPAAAAAAAASGATTTAAAKQ